MHEPTPQDGSRAEAATAHLVVVGGCQVGHQGALPRLADADGAGAGGGVLVHQVVHLQACSLITLGPPCKLAVPFIMQLHWVHSGPQQEVMAAHVQKLWLQTQGSYHRPSWRRRAAAAGGAPDACRWTGCSATAPVHQEGSPQLQRVSSGPQHAALCAGIAAPASRMGRQGLSAAIAGLGALCSRAHIHTILLCRLLHALPKVVVPDAAHVRCRTRNLQHPLCHTHRILSGTAGNVGHVLLLCQLLQSTASMPQSSHNLAAPLH